MDYHKNYLNLVKNAEGKKYVHEVTTQLFNHGVRTPAHEFRFHPVRRWRFDLAFPDIKLAVEIDGGGFGRVVMCHQCRAPVKRFLKDGRCVPVREGGRHSTGAGQEADHEKINEAILLGWRVLRFTPGQIKNGYALRAILQAINI